MIVKRLIELQKSKGLTDREFARSLDVHVGSWRRNKGAGVIGATIILRAFSVYPELKDYFLADAVERHEKRYNAFLSRLKNVLITIIDAEYLKGR